jgi:hypothetical protein
LRRPSRSFGLVEKQKNVTARQAFAALLDNHDLVLVEDAASGSAKVTPKPATDK